MDTASCLVFLFLPVAVFLTAMCLYKKMKETTDFHTRLNLGYPHPPALESPIPVQPYPIGSVPSYSAALNMRRNTAITIDSGRFTPPQQVYDIYEEMAHPLPMFSPFEPPPPYMGEAKIV